MDQRAFKLRENLTPRLRHIASKYERTVDDILLYIRYSIENDVFWFTYPSESAKEMTFQNELSEAISNAAIGTGFTAAYLDVPENRELHP